MLPPRLPVQMLQSELFKPPINNDQDARMMGEWGNELGVYIWAVTAAAEQWLAEDGNGYPPALIQVNLENCW